MKRKSPIFTLVLLIAIAFGGCHSNNDDAVQSLIAANDALMKGDQLVKRQVEEVYFWVKIQYAMVPRKMKDIYDKSQLVQKESESLIKFIQQVKYEVLSLVNDYSLEELEEKEEYSIKDQTSFLAEMKGLDDYSMPEHYFFDMRNNDKSKCRATELKYKIIAYKNKMKEILCKYAGFGVDVELGLNVEDEIPSKDGRKTQSWEEASFSHTILAADIVLLNSLILEVRNAEAYVVSMLLSAVSGPDYTFDSIGAEVLPESKHVKMGEEYVAEIFISAHNSTPKFKIVVGAGVDTSTMMVLGSPVVIQSENGVGVYRVKASSPGEHRFGGVIETVSRSGHVYKLPFQSSYFVDPK